MNITVLVFILILLAAGGGVGLALYLAFQKKKETWIANIYKLSDGKIVQRDEKGKIIEENLELNELVFYKRDFLEKLDYGTGNTKFALKNLKLTTPEPTPNSVITLDNRKYIDVLVDKNQATILTKGYNKERNLALFNPIPYSRLSSLENNRQLKKDRFEQDKSFWERAAPFIMGGMIVMGLFIWGWMMMKGYEDMSSKQLAVTQESLKVQKEISDNYRETMRSIMSIISGNPEIYNIETTELSKMLTNNTG